MKLQDTAILALWVVIWVIHLTCGWVLVSLVDWHFLSVLSLFQGKCWDGDLLPLLRIYHLLCINSVVYRVVEYSSIIFSRHSNIHTNYIAFQPEMEKCYQEHYSASSDIDSDLLSLGKGDLLLPRVHPVVKIKLRWVWPWDWWRHTTYCTSESSSMQG
jgi:hypothetical protein